MKTIATPVIRSKTGQYVNFQIRNITMFLGFGLLGTALFVLGIYLLLNKSINPDRVLALTFIFGIATISLLVARANYIGVIINKRTNSIQFPGGGISPNGFFHLLSPAFIIQHLISHKRNLSDIEMVTYDDRVKNINGKEIHSYGVTIAGSFGVIFIKMDSVNKAKSLYSALMNILDFKSTI